MALQDLRWNLPLRRFTDWVETKDERRLIFSFEACLDFFNTESDKKKILSPGLKWQEQRMTPSKITEGFLYAGFMQLFFNCKKRKCRKFWKSAGFLTNGVVGLRVKFTFKVLHRFSGNRGRTSFNLFIWSLPGLVYYGIW